MSDEPLPELERIEPTEADERLVGHITVEVPMRGGRIPDGFRPEPPPNEGDALLVPPELGLVTARDLDDALRRARRG